MKTMKKFKIDYVDRGGTEVSSAMQGLFGTVINSCGGRRFAGLRVAALMLLAFAMIFAPSSVYAAGGNNISGSTDSSTGTIKSGKDVLMLTVTTSKAAQGADLTKAIMTISGTGLVTGDINTIIANANGVEDGRVSPSSLTNFSINLNGVTLGGETWTFYINLKDSTVGITNLQLMLTALNGSDNNSSYVPKTTQENTVAQGCFAVAPSDVQLQSKSDTSITITWSVNSDNAYYRLYRNAGGGYKLYNGNVPLSENPYTDWGIGASNSLYPLTKYGFKIRGYDTTEVCESADSNILITQTKSDNKFQIYTCGGCHTTPPDDAPLTRGTPDGGTIGRHANPYHTGGVMEGVEVCVLCHVDHTEPAHRDKKIAMNSTAIFGYPGSFYDKDQSGTHTGSDDIFNQTNLPIHIDNATTQNGTCVNTWCHGSRGASPVWGFSSGNTQCNLCHGMSDGQISSDTEGDTAATDEQVGAHNSHLHLGTYSAPPTPSDFLNISSVNPCGECHLTPATHESSGHYDDGDPAEVVFGPIATNGYVLNPVYNNSTGVCTNTYCHDGRNFKNAWADATMVNVPTWFDSTYLDDGGSTDNCMNKCHGFPPGGEHDPGEDCATCHEHLEEDNFSYKAAYYYKHIDGVVQGLDCTDCHGTPPVDAASMANTPALGRSQRTVNYTNAWGAHSAHSTASVSCSGCHNGGQPGGGQHNDKTPTDINMGFIANGKAGEYQAPAIENATSYILNSGGSTTVTISGTAGDPRTCHNIYCHSDGGDYSDSFSFTTFDWDSLSGTTCSSCHDDPPTTDGHDKHASTYGYICFECHSDTVYENKTIGSKIGNHVNVVKNIEFGNLASGGDAYGDQGTGKCSNIYCHSDGKGSWQQVTTPAWDQTTTCMSCHGGPNGVTGGAGTSLGGSHTAHTDGTGKAYLCTDCHNNVVSATNTITTASLHSNITNNVYIMAANGGDGSDYNGTNCSTTWCHGTTSPDWGGGGDAPCGSCHGTNATSGAVPPDTGNSSDATDDEVGAHALHLQVSSTIANTDYLPQCNDCHTVPGSVGAVGHIDNSQPAEVPLDGDRARDFGAITAAQTQYNESTGECSNVYCHDTTFAENAWGGGALGNTPVWTDTAYIDGTGDCAQCHGNPPTNAGHDPGTVCSSCHDHVNSADEESFTNKQLHIDHVVQGKGCDGCHGQPPINDLSMVNAASQLGITQRTQNYTTSYGAHTIHNTSASMGCGNCHRGGKNTGVGTEQHDSGGSTILNIGIYVSSNEQGVYQAPAFTNSGSYSIVGYGGTTYTQSGVAGDPRTCGNTYCHGTSSPRWNNLAGSGCTNCHGDDTTFRDTGGSTAATDDEVGAHSAHLTASSGYTNTIGCGECHLEPTAWDDSGHVDDLQPAEVWLDGPMATNGGTDSAKTFYNTTTGTCYNTYCHDTEWTANNLSTGLAGGNTPSWTNTTYLDGSQANDCAICHGNPPATAHDPSTNCSSCHTHVDANDDNFTTWGNIVQHMDGQIQGGCCHGEPPTTYPLHATHNDSALVNGCDSCHGAGATTGAHTNHEDVTNTIVANVTSWDDATQNCTNNCHLPTGLNWDAGTLVCANCHTATYIGKGYPPATNKHVVHTDSTYYVAVANCEDCHNDNSGTHSTLDGTATSPALGLNVTAWSDPNCTNDCHLPANLNWASGTLVCANCHNASYIGMGNPPATNKHVVHTDSTYYVAAPNCGDCHSDNSGTHSTLDGSATSPALGLNVTAWSDPNCTNDCHLPANLNWGSGTLVCANCHTSSYIGMGNPPATNKHVVHTDSTNYVAVPNCGDCHGDNSGTHSTLDGSAASPTLGLNVTAWSDPNCTNDCHLPANLNWGSGTLVCVNCHATGYIADDEGAMPTTGLHDMSTATSHDETLSGGCAACHVSEHANHLNGAFTADSGSNTDRWVTRGSMTWTDGSTNTGTCSGTGLSSCHSDGGNWTRLWSAEADSAVTTVGDTRCKVCHGQYTTGWRTGTSHAGVFNPSTRGDTHNSLTGTANSCEDCHAYPSTESTNHNVDDLVTMNDDTVGAGGNTDITLTTGYIRCNACHTTNANPATDGTYTWPESTAFSYEEVNGANDPVGGECITCHDTGGSGVGGDNNRRAIVPEFGKTHGHRKSGNTLTNNDCGVCHMEGDPLDGSTTADHADEEVELRDPSDGTLFYMMPTGAHMVRDVGSSTIEPITSNVQSFCLACHNGVVIHADAQTPSGDSSNPWDSGTAALNVATQLSTSNTSYHPVLGTQDNSYCNQNTMISPWAYTKTPGTKSAGYLITCFDCHNEDSELASGSSSAHGTNDLDNLRAAVDASGSLCTECHDSSVYATTVVHGGSGSAWSGETESRHNLAVHTGGCAECHGNTSYEGTPPAGTADSAINAHGHNAAGQYSFLRSMTVDLGWTWEHTPVAQCTLMKCNTGKTYNETYGPGGAY